MTDSAPPRLSEYDEKLAFFLSGLVEPNDFALQCNDFLDKMKQSSAFELVKNIKKFISSFVQQQVPRPIEDLADEIRKFLDETSLVIERHPLWKNVSYEETEIAAEALERYTMHKVHKSVYSPSREDDARRDREFLQQLEVLSFITPDLLDIPLSGPTCEAGWDIASNQLKKMESCKSPRDKVTCVMNLFTVLCKLLVEVQSGNAAGADDLMPNVIYTILRAKPAHWYSDVRYIQRFRHPGRLSSEAGYYMTQMMGAVAFLEKVEGSHLSLSEEEFRKAKRGNYVPVRLPKPPKVKRSKANEEGSTEGGTVTEADNTGGASGEDASGAEVTEKEHTQPTNVTTATKTLSSSSASSLHSKASRTSRSGSHASCPSPSTDRRSKSLTHSQSSSPLVPRHQISEGPQHAATAAGASTAISSHSSSNTSLANGHQASASATVSVPGEDAFDSRASSATAAMALAAKHLHFSAADQQAERSVRKVSTVGPDLESITSSILSPLGSVCATPVPEAGIVERFLDCKFKELTIGDITELLKNYRILVHKYCTLRAQMTTTTATTAQAKLQAQLSVDRSATPATPMQPSQAQAQPESTTTSDAPVNLEKQSNGAGSDATAKGSSEGGDISDAGLVTSGSHVHGQSDVKPEDGTLVANLYALN